MTSSLCELYKILEVQGQAQYGDEAIDQLQHGLQCAALAQAEGASQALVAAALLHDVGHLVDKHAEGAAAKGVDRRHEDIGAGYLKRWYGPEVTEPIRLHVDAKRYLCATEPGYWESLSEASKLTLEVQGGPFSQEEAAQFIAQDYAEGAVLLRRWDDLGKDPQLAPLSLADFQATLEACLK